MRTIAEAHNYVYTLSPDTLWVQLYAASSLDTAWTDGARIKLRQETDYPWSGAVKLTIEAAPSRDVTLKLRIPGWVHAGSASIRLNGQRVPQPAPRPGTYLELKRAWKAGDTVDLALDFAPTLWEANPLVEETLGQVAVKYGPLVYCVESNDLPDGVKLIDVAIAPGAKPAYFTAARGTIANASVLTLATRAVALQRPHWTATELYREAARPTPREFELKLVPYYVWGNRGDSEMTVWLPVR